MRDRAHSATPRAVGAVILAAVGLILIASCMLWRKPPPPSLQVWLHPSNVGQGKTLVVWVSSSQPLSEIQGRLEKRNLTFHPLVVGEGTRYRSIIGIPMDMALGEYKLEIEVTGPRGRRVSQQRILTIEKTEFAKEEISIPSEKTNLLTSKYLPEEARAIRAARRDSHKSQLWKGRFIQPTAGRISSPFGARRSYNRGTASWRHKGVDIANREGTAILAPNSGLVVLSEPMEVHGETVILDHGQGVFSIFNHFKKRLVEIGDRVETGEKIGLMGQTGLATGPHLHWGLYVSGVAVEPLEWTERAMDESP